jgi:agmatinase
MQEAYADLLSRDTPRGPDSVADSLPSNGLKALARDGKSHPRIATLGGDHSIVLPILRALFDVYGPITVLHWDSHLDSWAPAAYGKASQSSQAGYNHGTMVSLSPKKKRVSLH